MADDYWSKPYPRKAPIRESATAPPAQAAPLIIDGKRAPPSDAILVDDETFRKLVEATKEDEKPKVSAPTLDSWPEAPPGTYYTIVASDWCEPIPPNSQHTRVAIAPDSRFKPKFLWVRPMRDVFLTDFKIGNLSFMNCYGVLATSVFRRFVPWNTATAEVGNIISLTFANRHSSRIYTPEVAILGLSMLEPLRVGGPTSWNP